FPSPARASVPKRAMDPAGCQARKALVRIRQAASRKSTALTKAETVNERSIAYRSGLSTPPTAAPSWNVVASKPLTAPRSDADTLDIDIETSVARNRDLNNAIIAYDDMTNRGALAANGAGRAQTAVSAASVAAIAAGDVNRR